MMPFWPRSPQYSQGKCLAARAVARRPQLPELGLLAAMRLSRLWQQQGNPPVARQLLVPLYNRFTEGLDTADLQEAKALREDLRSYS
jgi:hypothetical protein